ADPNGQDFYIRPFSDRCENVYIGYWVAGFYIYKGILLVGDEFQTLTNYIRIKTQGVFMPLCLFQMTTLIIVWTTSHKVLPAVNDLRSVQFSVFVSVPVIVTGVWASMLWEHQPDVQFCIIALVIITCCCSTLCMVFLPKIIIISKGPDSVLLSRRFHLTQWCSELEKDSDKDRKRNLLELNISGEAELETDEAQAISASLENLRSENLQLTAHINEVKEFERQLMQLDTELEALTRQLNQLCETNSGGMENVIVRGIVHRA
ncbi:hypothetical protein DNTS_005738, partial [Danionella cerebrum]